MSTLTNQKGSVMYVCRNVSQNYLALRYDGAAVIVTGDLLKNKDFLADDIIEFDANPIGRADAALYNTVKPKWKATRIKFLKHAEQWKGTAKVVTMDAQGEYCFLEGKDPKGVNYNIFCTRISVIPPVDKLGSIFSTGSTVRVICKEQVATAKNNNVKWRTVAATDLKHELKVKAGAPLNSYEIVAVPSAAPPAPPKFIPKPKIAPSNPRPATAAAAVKSTPLATVQTTPAPKKDLASLTIAQVVNSKPPMPSPISPPTPTAVASEKAVFAPPPPGLAPATLSSLPIPSYEWMKFDLISTIREKYPTPPESDLQDENRKLREISHRLSQGNCFCLSH